MKSMMRKTTVREIRNSFGRYIAILAIVALGVGFFAGVKMAKPDMVATAESYFKENNLYDYQLLSTLGFRKKDVEVVRTQADVAVAQGAISADVSVTGQNGNSIALKAHSITDGVNGLVLHAGRMPQAANECVVDALIYDESIIGKTIRLSDENEEDTLDMFAYEEYVVVGTVQSVLYTNFERGTTSIGSGTLQGFFYVPEEGFDVDYYTEIYVKFAPEFSLYSEEYDAFIDKKQDAWEEFLDTLATDRYDEIKADAQAELDEARAEFDTKKADAETELADAQAELTDAETQIAEGRQELADAKEELKKQEADLEAAQLELEEGKQKLEEQEAQINQMLLYPQTAIQGQAAKLQLEEAKETIAQSEQQIADAKEQIADAWDTIDEEEKKLLEAETELADGWLEYNDAKAEFDTEIADAQNEIDDAQKEINDISTPDTYVLGRDTNIGYACFNNDTDIVAAIADIFPIFFFLVAALVCMTTMNRMIEEQRTQIGTLKALGYSRNTIMGKYMFYAGSAGVIGCVGGFFGGTWLFPTVIWFAYNMLYTMKELVFVFDAGLAIVSFLATLLCTLGVTWFTCKQELKMTAAQLMRPKAPRAGKRVFMEYIPFVWNRLKFLQKVSIRNIVRYKKRFFMMVFGISGCTALLLAGMGLKDSVAGIVSQQYEEIQIYDMSVMLSDSEKEDEAQLLAQKAQEKGYDYMLVYEKTRDLLFGEKRKSVSVVVMEQPEQTAKFVDLHDLEGNPLTYPQDGEVILTNGAAEQLGIAVGDTVVLRDEKMQEMSVRVASIAENYVGSYVYLTEETFARQTGMMPEYTTAYLNAQGADLHAVSADFMKENWVMAVTVNEDTAARFESMMESLDYVVLLVIVSAAFLAFIVLYNLTNINITERVREIATIKVLGFYRKETSSYVFRENVVLTAIGILVGEFLGILLHAFIMSKLIIDLVSFPVVIAWRSYVFSILLTFAFAMLVNAVMSFKLDKINMAESLKSVD